MAARLVGFWLLLAVILISGPGFSARASPPAAGPPPPPVERATAAPPRAVRVADLPAAAPGEAQAPRAVPLLPLDPAEYDRAKRQPQAPRNGPRTLGLAPAVTATELVVLRSFPVMNQVSQQAASGGVYFPPDTQLAAGPYHLFELVNSAAAVWSKDGALVKWFSLNAFFQAPPGYLVGDPRVLYDPLTGRWFASAFGRDDLFCNSQVYLAVSWTYDPTGLWWVYTLRSNLAGVVYDQPFLSVTADKVVVSWNDYSGGSFGNCSGSFSGQETWVVDKATVLNGAQPAMQGFGPDFCRFRVVPAQALTFSNPAYLVYNGWRSPPCVNNGYLGLVVLSGSPALGNVTWSETTLSMPPTSIPPVAYDFSLLPATPLDTGDDRFLGAVWQNGVLWTGGNTGCVPPGDLYVRSCLRLVQVSTTTYQVIQSFDVGYSPPAGYLMYPAVSLDPAGNLTVVFSAVGNFHPAVYAAFAPAAGPPYQLFGLTPLSSGSTAYYCSVDPRRNGSYRWGDYSAAAPDPAEPGTVWVAGEYSAPAAVDCNWGTWAAQLKAKVNYRLWLPFLAAN